MTKEANLIAAVVLQEPRVGFMINPDKSKSHFIEVNGEKIVCLAKGGECRHYGRYYTGSLNDTDSWVTPTISESCPNSCPYKHLVCEGERHKDHDYIEYYPEYNKYPEFRRYCKHFENIPIEDYESKIKKLINGMRRFTMIEKKLHFWYSKKSEINMFFEIKIEKRYKNYANIDGKVVFYTEYSEEREYPAFWDDAEYLGEGVYDHNEVVE